MATYNIQVEDSEGNKYHPKPDLLTTKEQLRANTAAGKSVDALVVKELDNNLMSRPQFIYDVSGKITGYRTKGGADTVFPFSSLENMTYQCTLRCINDTVPSTATVVLPENFESIDISISTSAGTYANKNTGYFSIDSATVIKQMPSKNGTYNFAYNKDDLPGATKISINSGRGNNCAISATVTINFV